MSDPEQSEPAKELKDRKARRDWFKSLEVKGDFSPASLDGYFLTVQEWLRKDMVFLGSPIERWEGRSSWLRRLAFIAVAAGVILPLPIFGPLPGWPTGLELGYLSVLIGGLIVLVDQVFSVSSSWMRLTLAEMQMKQARYRLDLDWAKRRPLLTPDNGATEGPILIEALRTAMDGAHEIMETQKKTWTNELKQGMEVLRGRLDADRVTLERLRTERQQEEARVRTGGITIKIDKPQELTGTLKVKVGDLPQEDVTPIPPSWPVVGLAPGILRVVVEASRVAPTGSVFKAALPVEVVAGEVKDVSFTV